MTSTILSLPDEVLDLILEQAHLHDPDSTWTLRLICRRVNSLELPRRYRCIVLTPEKLYQLCSVSESCSSEFLLRQNVTSFARDVLVTGKGFHWPSLLKLIVEMEHLSILRWGSWHQHFPESIRDHLASRNPKPSIFIQDLELINGPLAVDYPPEEDPLHGLPGDLNIRAIDVKINYLKHTITSRLEDFLFHCPNLRTLRIRDTWPRVSVPYYPLYIFGQVASTSGSYASIDAKKRDSRLQLQELVCEDYPPPRARPVSRWNPWTPLKLIDWNFLLHLELRGQRIFPLIEDLTLIPSSLRSLTVESFFTSGSRSQDDATQFLINFLSNVKNLKSLTLVNEMEVLPVNVFAQQGGALEHLCCHWPRYPRNTYSRATSLPLEDMQSIGDACPNIRSLTLDFDITLDLNTNFLSTISQLSHLTTLRLYLKMTFDHWQQSTNHITLDIQMIHHIATHLMDTKIGRRFRTIEMMIDDKLHTADHQWRPLILFTVHMDEEGELVVDYNIAEEIEEHKWDNYFDPEKLPLDVERGVAEWLRWNRIGKEVDEMLEGVANKGCLRGTDDLFDEMADKDEFNCN